MKKFVPLSLFFKKIDKLIQNTKCSIAVCGFCLAFLLLFSNQTTLAQGEWKCGQYVSRQIQVSSTVWKTEFVQISTDPGLVYVDILATNTTNLINATAFYGGYIWGWKQFAGVNQNDGSTGNVLCKIGNNGQVISTFDPSGATDVTISPNAAFVDENGIYYVISNSTQSTLTLARIDLKTATPTSLPNVVITFPSSYNAAGATNFNTGDFVVSNGIVYLWLNNRGLSKFNVPIAAATVGTGTPIGTIPTNRVEGSLFISAGDPTVIYGYGSNDGGAAGTPGLQDRLQTINKTTGVIIESVTSASVSQSDGCGCPFDTFQYFAGALDSDADGVIDALDLDADNDGVPDEQECPTVLVKSNGLTLLKGTATNLVLGDKLLKTNALTYLGVSYDAVISIATKNGTVSLGTGGALAVTGAPNTNPYVTYTLTFVTSGSATAANTDGSPVTLKNVIINMFDLDGLAGTNITEVGGILTSVNSVDVSIGSNLVNATNLASTTEGFLSTGSVRPPPGFTTFRTPAIPSVDKTDGAGLKADGAVISYDQVTSTQLIFGFTGTSSVSTTRTEETSYSTNWRCDDDGDGKPNILDTDSDGDGCNDNVEAGATTNPATPVLATTAAGVDTKGVPKVVLTTQNQDPPVLNYTPTYSKASNPAINGCIVNITGNVFNDLNGGTDNTVNGVGTNGGGLNANLIGADGKIVATVPVNASGVYNFVGVPVGTYSVQISTVAGTVGSNPPAQTLPAGYVNTGDNNGTGVGNDTTTPGVSATFSAINNVTNVNFGIEQPPTAVTVTLPVQANPGGANSVPVTPNFGGNDPNGGAITSIKILTFPTNAETITINGTVYTSGNFPVGGVTIPTNASGVPSQGISVNPIDGNTTVAIPYITIDAAGKTSDPLNPAKVNVPFVSPKISGKVFDDADGATDNQVDGVGTNGGGLNANLLDNTGKVVATIPVNADGTYDFLNVLPGSYTVQISTNAGVVGSAAPATVLPAGFVKTGENNGAGAGIDATIDSKSEPFSVALTDVANINFGMEKPPLAGSITLAPDVNPGGTVNKTITSNFSGTDADGTVDKIRITAFPTNATSISVNGVTYLSTDPIWPANGGAGITVPAPGGVPSQSISIDPIDGNVTVSVPYKTIDNAGKESALDGKVDVPFISIEVAGKVFNDTNGATDNQINGTGTNGGGLNANLLDGAGNVVKTIPVNADGTYKFTDVVPGNYTVQINTVAGTVGSPAPAASLPGTFLPTGENNGAGAGIDATVNSKSEPFSVVSTNVSNINFGIEQPPLAGTAVLPTEVNPGGTVNKTITSNFSGTDVDGGTVDKIRITAFPANATSITIGATTYTSATFPIGGVTVTAPGGVPSQAISIDPIDGNVTVAVLYKTIDNAGKESTLEGKVEVPFTSVEVTGKVFNDPDGATDGQVDGTGTNGGGLHANLLDGAGNVVKTVPVNADGTYKFTDVTPGNYTVQINAVAGTIGSSAPASALLGKFVKTGENNGAGAGIDPTIDSKSEVFSVVNMNIGEINFGIEQPPLAGTITLPADVNPGGTVSKTITSNFSGTDVDGGTVDNIRITAFPTNATSISVNGITYTSSTFPVGGIIVPAPGGVPSQAIAIDPIDGIVTVSVPYTTIDNAGKESTLPGAVNVPFVSPKINGSVFKDSNGLTDMTVNGPVYTGANLNANLLDAGGNIVATVPVKADGTYEFINVSPGTYTVQVNTIAGTIGSPAPAVILPTGYGNTGENNDVPTVTGSDGTVNSQSSPFTIVSTDLANINFGIEQLPVATNNQSLANNPEPVTQQVVTENDLDGIDSDADGTLNLSTVDLDPTTPGRQTTKTVAGEGVWTVDNLGNVTFTPESGFTKDPTPITYTINDNAGLTSNVANIIVDYVPITADNTDTFLGVPKTVSPLINDTAGDTPVATTISLIGGTDTDGDGDLDQLVVAGQGTWKANPDGTVTFTPITGFVSNPTPINYTVKDNDGNTSNPSKITLVAPPIANDDQDLANAPQTVATTNLLDDDKKGDGTTPLPADVTVDLNPSVAGDQTTLVVAGQGTWAYNPATGDFTFTPLPSFLGDPTPIPYKLTETATGLSDNAIITVDYVPVATDDKGSFTGATVTLNPLTNDITGDTVDPTTVKFTTTGSPVGSTLSPDGKTLTVPGEGVWTVNPTTGEVTFTPVPGFITNPTPVTYTVADNDGNITSAKITLEAPPIANNDSDLSNAPQVVATGNLLDDDLKGNGTTPLPNEVTVDLNPSTPAVETSLVVAGEGTWAYNPATGDFTFTPLPTFFGDPTPIPYKLTEIATGLSDEAIIVVDYVPVTSPNVDTYLNNTPKIISVLTNDTGGDTPVVTTISIAGGSDTDGDGDLDQLVVVGQGTWKANPDGTITFTPENNYKGNPTPITYTVKDDEGNTSNGSTVTLTNGSPLPVDIISFEGKQFEEQINLTWKVANEKEFSHFELQKSRDAKEFGAIAIIKTAGKSIYDYSDIQPEIGENYYRLKMFDSDGTSKLSKIVSINFEKNGSFIAVENPAINGEFKVMTNLKNAKFTLMNGLGVRIGTSLTDLGNNNFQIKVAQPIAGLYYLNIESNGKLQTTKVLVP